MLGLKITFAGVDSGIVSLDVDGKRVTLVDRTVEQVKFGANAYEFQVLDVRGADDPSAHLTLRVTQVGQAPGE